MNYEDVVNKFRISINKSDVNVSIDENMDEQDIIELLKFDESIIEELLFTHAANQAYWEALAIRLKNKYESFKDNWYKKWWSYNKIYSRYVLIGFGDSKPTVDSINDMTVIIYSSDRSDLEREKYGNIACSVCSNKFKSEIKFSEQEFFDNMFVFLKSYSVPWYFETVVDTLKKFQEDYELVKIVAEKLNARSFHMQNILELMKAKSSNIGPMSVNDKNVIDRVSKSRNKQGDVR